MLVADPGAVAVISVGFTMCMDGVTVRCIPDTLPRRPSVAPTLDTLPRLALDQGFLFLLDGQHRAHLFNRAVGSSCCIVEPIATGEIGVEGPVCTSALCVCVGVRTSEPSAEGKLDVLRATPLIVTRFHSDGSVGVDHESDGGSAAT